MIQAVSNIQNGLKYFERVRMNMKKSVVFFLIISILFSFTGCFKTYYLNCADVDEGKDSGSIQVNLGETYDLNVETNDDYVNYYSSDTSVATVSNDGIVKGIANPLDYEYSFPTCEITIETPNAGIKTIYVMVVWKTVLCSTLISNQDGGMYCYDSERSVKINYGFKYVGDKTVNKLTCRIIAYDHNGDMIMIGDMSKGKYGVISTFDYNQDIVFNGPIDNDKSLSISPYLYIGEEYDNYFKIEFIYFFEFSDCTYSRCEDYRYFEGG